jgi:hypothetical protein
MVSKFAKKRKNDLKKPVTLGVLLEYTDEFLIPKMYEMTQEMIQDEHIGMVKILKEEIAKSTHEIKSYMDDKLGEYTSDIFKRLDKKYQKDRQFKAKVVELFKKHNIGTKEDLAFLEGVVSMS